MGNANGSQNSNYFRQQLFHNLLPKESSINVEGLFNEYYFDTGITKTNDLIHSTYQFASVKNILTNEQELYMTIGLNSCEDGKNERKYLNLIIVLDVSGSMSELFDNNSFNTSNEHSHMTKESKRKIHVAKQVLIELIHNLDAENERLGIVLFNQNANLLQPIRKVKEININELIERIDGIVPNGGTNMECGMIMGIDMLSDLLNENVNDTNNNRIIFLTDAQPNLGGEKSLLDLSKRAASKNSIYITYIGIGLDFNSDLVYELTKIHGSNYFSVHSSQEFVRILNNDFNYIVNPIGFNIITFIDSEKYEIDKIYGIPTSNEHEKSNYVRIDSVTPSAVDDKGCVKGSMIVVKFREKLTSNLNPSNSIQLTMRYENIHGQKQQQTIPTIININDKQDIFYDNLGIRKAILLLHYTLLIKNIIEDVNHHTKTYYDDLINKEQQHRLTDNTKMSTMVLKISKNMKNDLLKFRSHFIDEMKILDDNNLKKELDIIDKFRYAEEI
ncbi:unnamed protein product [Didymodactylos carnosus]|uniref:VWFA domain-containing protein n=1 Tax=Didymodactylos carnosus TaxID=1234261 RepID=A0A8S2F292_9BILA|nr:unnamed protein product [Didymodactylos carnosus]CAF4169709.1 unnamed protein product [Didymodactylos carnosus]